MAERLELTEQIQDQAGAIELQEVDSSQIAKIGYNPEASLLMIEFHNKKGENTQYVYPEVSQEQWDAFESADSVGSHFFRNLKNLDFCKLEG